MVCFACWCLSSTWHRVERARKPLICGMMCVAPRAAAGSPPEVRNRTVPTHVFNYIQCTIQYDKLWRLRAERRRGRNASVNILTIYINALYITNPRARTTLAEQHNIQRNRSTLSIRYNTKNWLENLNSLWALCVRGWEYVGGAPRLGLLFRVVLLQEGVGAAVARAEGPRARRASCAARASWASCATGGVERNCETSWRAGDGRARGLAWPRRAARRGVTRGRAWGVPRRRAWRCARWHARRARALRLPYDGWRRPARFYCFRRTVALCKYIKY